MYSFMPDKLQSRKKMFFDFSDGKTYYPPNLFISLIELKNIH